MRKRAVIGTVVTGIIALGIIGSNSNHGQAPNLNNVRPDSPVSTSPKPKEKVKEVCDGRTVVASCALDGVNYKTYVYHPAIAEKSHTETVTTYKEEVTSYCTRCNDGSYSPSCATGRGACSHHGGVAEWNAPITSSVPVNSTKTVVDSPAQNAYYEKVAE